MDVPRLHRQMNSFAFGLKVEQTGRNGLENVPGSIRRYLLEKMAGEAVMISGNGHKGSENVIEGGNGVKGPSEVIDGGNGNGNGANKANTPEIKTNLEGQMPVDTSPIEEP